MNTITAKILSHVEADKRSEREISRAAGLSPGFVNSLKNNPDRDISTANARALFAALGVNPDAALSDAEHSKSVHGFSESNVVAWEMPDPGGQRQDLALDRRRIVRALAPNAKNPATFRVLSPPNGFAYRRSDILIVDLNARSDSGDIVLATVADLSTGAGKTVIRRFLSPYLVSPDPDDDEQSLVVDGHRTVIMGPVVGSFRAPQVVLSN